MTVAAAVAVVAPAEREGKHGTYVGAGEESHRRETIAAVAAAAAACHHRETIAAATAAATTCHRRETRIAAAVAAAAAACHHHDTSVAVAAAAAACHHRETSVLLWLLLLSMQAIAVHGPPVPKTTADDKSIRVRGFRRRTHCRPLFRNLWALR